MITNPASKDKNSEAVILAALVKLGKSVLIPSGEERYDLALDEGASWVRMQCKTRHTQRSRRAQTGPCGLLPA